ncbi:uncharacterized protein LOC123507945 [Portunus trituberculatus]|uniref:uncharacterized protein LOC123507945 n=1 Tax=Portunus trituberculatus TaxID=210409 RepID=UPI001E1CB4F4|nr:uncharacterized protein LOC123507945 [Portunus trituberculatus]
MDCNCCVGGCGRGRSEGTNVTRPHSLSRPYEAPAHQGHAHKHHTPKKLPGSKQDRADPKRLPQENRASPQLLEDNELFRDREHLKEELPEYMNIEKIEQMSDKELDYHYFSMHDFDNNLKLDGLEILAALGHVVDEAEGEEDEEEGKEGTAQDDEALKGLSDEERKVVRQYRYQKWEDSWKFYIELVDGVLENNDQDKDGFISWREFLRGRNRKI